MAFSPPIDAAAASESLVNSKMRLTTSLQKSTSPEPDKAAAYHPYQRASRSSFSFPTLSGDGSVDDLTRSAIDHTETPPYFPTPPAALSSRGPDTMVAVPRPLDESVGSLGDPYILVDDAASENSFDGQETASIASTSSDFNDGESTVENVPYITREGYSGEDEQPAVAAGSERPDEQMLDSFLTEDLETPRQSMIAGTIFSDPNRSPFLESSAVLTRHETPLPLTHAGHGGDSDKSRDVTPHKGYSLQHITLVAFSIIGVFLALWLPFSVNQKTPLREEVMARREVLSSTFGDSVNLNHLLPFSIGYTADNYPGHVPFQGLLPNHIVVSFSKQPGARKYPFVQSARAYTPSNVSVDFDMNQLIDGIYVFSIAPRRAHGRISVDILVDNPHMEFTAWHDFGVGESLLPWKQNMWKSRIAAPLCAGVKATRAVTTDLTTQMTKELQVFRKNTLQMLQTMVRKSNITSLSKDLMVVQKDLIIWSEGLQKRWSTAAKSMVDTLAPTRQDIRASLDRSHSQARRLAIPFSRIGKAVASGASQRPFSNKKSCKNIASELK